MIIKRYIYLFLCIPQIYFLSVSEGVDASTKVAEPSKEERLKDTIAELSGGSEDSSSSRKRRKKNKDKPSRYPDSETVLLVSAALFSALSYNAVTSTHTASPNTTYIYKLPPENISPVPVIIEEELPVSSESQQSMSESLSYASEEEETPLPSEDTVSDEPNISQATPLSILITPPSESDDLPMDENNKSDQPSQLLQPKDLIPSRKSSIMTQTEGRIIAAAPGAGFEAEVPVPKPSAPPEPEEEKSRELSKEEPNNIKTPIGYNNLSSEDVDTDAYDADNDAPKSEDTDADNNKPVKRKKFRGTRKRFSRYKRNIGNAIQQNVEINKQKLIEIKNKIPSRNRNNEQEKNNENNEEEKKPGEASVSQESVVNEQIVDNKKNIAFGQVIAGV